MSKRRYLGSWTLPSGNSADVYLGPAGLVCHWDAAPSPTWPPGDVDHWRAVTFPAILRAVADATGALVVGVSTSGADMVNAADRAASPSSGG